MEQLLVKPTGQAEPAKQPDALFLARLEIEAQHRFVRRVLAGLTVFLLLWLVGLWYFNKSFWAQEWRSKGQVPQSQAQAGSGVEGAQVEQLSQELVRLQQHLSRTLGDSLALKLETLEERIRTGQAGGFKDLELIQSIKEDIGWLLAQGSSSPAPPVGQTGIAKGPDLLLLERFSRLETLVYLSFGALAAILVAVGGYFFRYSIQLKRLRADVTQLSSQLPSPRRP
ncbi:hypothetical protein JCM13664_08030 [Methylothermus subterraneus]